MGNEVLIGFGWLSLMIVVGSFLRYKINFLQKMLIPSSAIGGIVGFILINFGLIQIPQGLLQTFVAQFFIISFISIGLTGTGSHNNNGLTKQKNGSTLTKGVIWFAVAWGLLVNLQALMGMLTIKGLNIFGESMDPMYGILLPFGFSMGTGQAISYGGVAEEIGFQNAASVAITFAVVGYIFATFVGIPLARYGIRKGLAKNSEKLSKNLLKGVMEKDKPEKMGNLTFHSSNLETLAFHIAIIGAVYLIAYYSMTWLSEILPANLASFIMGSLFIFGVLWGMIFSTAAKKLKISHLFSDDLQKSLTGWMVDFMIVASFMSISLASIQQFLLPIIFVTVIGGILTTVICFYIGQRMGSNYDFERSISFYGMVTGQVPNSLLLLRIVILDLKPHQFLK
ncbi:sodium/glutamate symporter [Virgibacillus halodenitrificans]|uniref:sodium/glutamate symporter n=1 Tax=Virgibacillus halodenitrificans TaxID=1482 RepID=UPI000761B7DE